MLLLLNHWCLDAAAVLHCRFFALLWRKKLLANMEELPPLQKDLNSLLSSEAYKLKHNYGV